VPDFEKFIKKHPAQKIKKPMNFSGIKLPLSVTITAEKVFVENGLNDQKNKLKFSHPKKLLWICKLFKFFLIAYMLLSKYPSYIDVTKSFSVWIAQLPCSDQFDFALNEI
jgi:hypothetical protein